MNGHEKSTDGVVAIPQFYRILNYTVRIAGVVFVIIKRSVAQTLYCALKREGWPRVALF